MNNAGKGEEGERGGRRKELRRGEERGGRGEGEGRS